MVSRQNSRCRCRLFVCAIRFQKFFVILFLQSIYFFKVPVLLKILHELTPRKAIIFIYNGAKSYKVVIYLFFRFDLNNSVYCTATAVCVANRVFSVCDKATFPSVYFLQTALLCTSRSAYTLCQLIYDFIKISDSCA